MIIRIKIFFLFLGLFFSSVAYNLMSAQEEPPVIINRSVEVHQIDGEKYHIHAVLKGQTLYSIARAYDVTVEDIIAENPELKSGLVYNQEIKIPYVDKPKHIDSENDFIKHKVKRRETLFGISKQYDVSIDKILQFNPEARRGLKTNQVLLIPQKIEEKEPSFKKYEVYPGETLYSLSRKFNVSVEEIKELNPKLDYVLEPGEKIKLPHHVEIAKKEDMIKQEEDEDIDAYGKQLWDEDYCNEPVLQEQYDVALLIPLFLEDVDEYYKADEQLPERHKSFTFLDFYEGVLIALDSAEKMGANINIHVFDVCQDADKALDIVYKPWFKEMDLIIGPFFAETLKIIAEHAEKNEVAVVSPFLQSREQLKLYPNIFQFTPSLMTQLNYLAKYVSYKYSAQNIILVHDAQPRLTDIVDGFRHNLNKQVGERRYEEDLLNLARVNGYYYDQPLIGGRVTNVQVFNDSLLENFPPPLEKKTDEKEREVFDNYLEYDHINEVLLFKDSIGGITEVLSENRKNVIVSLLGGEPLVSNYLRELSLVSDTFDIKVFGVPQWRNYNNLSIDHLQSTGVHIITPDFVDYSDKNIKNFVLNYRNRFKNEPGMYAFKGVEIGFFFMNALMTYGNKFYKCTYEINNLESNNINFSKTIGINNGWENNRTTIIKYDDYRMIDVSKLIMVEN